MQGRRTRSTRCERTCQHEERRTQRTSSPHPGCRVADSARVHSYLRPDSAPRRATGASAPGGLRASRAASWHVCPLAARRKCAGGNQRSVGARDESTTPPRAGRRSLRLTGSNIPRFVSMATKAVAFGINVSRTRGLLIHTAGQKAAVYRQQVSRHEARRLGRQKHRRPRDFLRLSKAFHRRAGQELAATVGAVEQSLI